MITIAFDESALTKLSNADFEFLQEHKDKLCVMPMSITLDGREINLRFAYETKYRNERCKFIDNYYKTLGATNRNNIEFVTPEYFDIWNTLYEVLSSGNDILYLRPPVDVAKSDEKLWTIVKELSAKFPDRQISVVNSQTIGSEYGKSVVKCLELLVKNPPFNVLQNVIFKQGLKKRQWFFIDDLSNIPTRTIFKNLHWVPFENRIAYGHIEHNCTNNLVIDAAKRPYGLYSTSNRGPLINNMAREIVDVFHQIKASEIIIEYARNRSDMGRIVHTIHNLEETIVIKTSGQLEPIVIKTSGQLEPTTAAYLGVGSMVITLR